MNHIFKYSHFIKEDIETEHEVRDIFNIINDDERFKVKLIRKRNELVYTIEPSEWVFNRRYLYDACQEIVHRLNNNNIIFRIGSYIHGRSYGVNWDNFTDSDKENVSEVLFYISTTNDENYDPHHRY